MGRVCVCVCVCMHIWMCACLCDCFDVSEICLDKSCACMKAVRIWVENVFCADRNTQTCWNAKNRHCMNTGVDGGTFMCSRCSLACFCTHTVSQGESWKGTVAIRHGHQTKMENTVPIPCSEQKWNHFNSGDRGCHLQLVTLHVVDVTANKNWSVLFGYMAAHPTQSTAHLLNMAFLKIQLTEARTCINMIRTT